MSKMALPKYVLTFFSNISDAVGLNLHTNSSVNNLLKIFLENTSEVGILILSMLSNFVGSHVSLLSVHIIVDQPMVVRTYCERIKVQLNFKG